MKKSYEDAKQIKSNKSSRKQRGITLVALVITIIVIIILASVTIGTVFGDNGLINNAKFAAFSAKVRMYQDDVDTYVLSKQLENEDTEIKINVSDKEEIKKIISRNK